MFTHSFSDPPPPNNLHILCVSYWGESLNTNFADVRGRGLLLCGPKRTREGRGGINRFFANVLYGWSLYNIAIILAWFNTLCQNLSETAKDKFSIKSVVYHNLS